MKIYQQRYQLKTGIEGSVQIEAEIIYAELVK